MKKMSKEMRISTKNLPMDMIEYILLRLPVKPLLRFKCVCRDWRNLIMSAAFIKKHLSGSLANNTYHCMIWTTDALLYSVDLYSPPLQVLVEFEHQPNFLTFCSKIVGSCNGLICVYSYSGLFLWNPSTRRHHKLPSLPVRTSTVYYGFGYDHKNNDYKVVYLYNRYEKLGNPEGDMTPRLWVHVYVFSLSTNSWRWIRQMPFLHLPIPSTVNNGVLANSRLHWTDSAIIVSFGLEDEEYGEVPMPDSVHGEIGIRVGVLGEQLCLVCGFMRNHFDFWVMTKYGVKESWTKQFSVQHSSLNAELAWCLTPICYSKHGEVVLELGAEQLILYDPHTLSVRDLTVSHSCIIEAAIYVWSLFPLNSVDETRTEEEVGE